MTLSQIRERYNVHAFRGVRMRYFGGKSPIEGHIVSNKGGKLRLACADGLRIYVHPDYNVQYLDNDGRVFDDRTELVPDREPDGKFLGFSHWANKAEAMIGGTRAACFDALDRRCRVGRDFMRADSEGAFPVRFWMPEVTL